MFFKFFKRKKVKFVSSRNEHFGDVTSLIEDIKKLTKSQKIDKVNLVEQHLLLISKINSDVARILHGTEEPTYVMSSLFLHNSFTFLNQQEEESVHFITGPERGSAKFLEQIIPFKLDVQTIVGAEGNSRDVHRVLGKLQELEYKLLGYFHIHPGEGPNAIYPSSVDLKLQDILERGGYGAIGAIFSRDGYLRFHASRLPNIEIFGKGVEKINESLYHLSKIGWVPGSRDSISRP
jgi:proteasome lid subunit RPN8/RPN11